MKQITLDIENKGNTLEGEMINKQVVHDQKVKVKLVMETVKEVKVGRGFNRAVVCCLLCVIVTKI